jgi:integrase
MSCTTANGIGCLSMTSRWREGRRHRSRPSRKPSRSGTRAGSGKRVSNRKALAQIDLHWHDLRHEALSRLADDGVPVHELQLLAGHSSITTTQRYMNARASSLAESMRQARERRVNRVEHADEATAQIG